MLKGKTMVTPQWDLDTFTLEELIFSETAYRKGLSNIPNDTAIACLRELCQQVLIPLQAKADALKRSPRIKILSGYRSQNINALIGGSATSQHCKGQAVDLIIPGLTVMQAIEIVRDSLLFDQLINEFDRWVHISYNSIKNRSQALRALYCENKIVYTKI